jgi:hypothetical protein
MPDRKIPKSFRLSATTTARIERIAQHHGGLTATRVLELAVEALHGQVFPRETARPTTRDRRTRP